MNRDFTRGLAIGFVLCASVTAGLLRMDEGFDDVALAAQRDSTQTWKDSSAWLGKAVRHYVGRLDSANAEVHQLREELAPRVESVIDRARVIHVAEPSVVDSGQQFMVPFQDTTRMRTIQRAGIDSLPWLTPGFLVDAWQEAVSVALFADSVIRRQNARYSIAVSIIQTQASQRRADSLTILSQGVEIAMWESRANPRCGRKCGIAIGATGAVLAIYAAAEVLGVVGDPPKGKTFYVPALHLRF